MGEILVVGAGAAGMMAAIAAGRAGHKVTILEQNEKCGKKLFITGKGRCNLTNNCEETELFAHVIRNPKFLFSAFSSYSPQDAMEFFQEAGCPVKTERGGRVFPESDHATDVIDALKRACRKEKVTILLGEKVKEILTEEGHFSGVRTTRGKEYPGTSLILATGGYSYPSTGSTGDGFAFAKSLGHTITPCRPSLVPFVTRETWCKEVMGLSLRNVTLQLLVDGKKKYEELGEMLFTHFGISGPLVLSASCYLPEVPGKEGKTEVRIDCKPGMKPEELDQRLREDLEASPKKELVHALEHRMPKSLVPVMVHLAGLSPHQEAGTVTRAERESLGKVMKHLPLTIVGVRDYNEAIITRGGVKIQEVNPKTMESKLVPGVFFAGEVLDLDGTTGGFNLQIAWATGMAAGTHVY